MSVATRSGWVGVSPVSLSVQLPSSRGADFLIVHQPVMSVDDWQTLDTLNVPWYASADDLSGDMTPTGAVIWDGDAWIGARLLAPS